jgi:hypothetical protein
MLLPSSVCNVCSCRIGHAFAYYSISWDPGDLGILSRIPNTLGMWTTLFLCSLNILYTIWQCYWTWRTCASFEDKWRMSSSIYMYLDAMPLFDTIFYSTQCMDACSFYQISWALWYIAFPKIQFKYMHLSQSLFYFILYKMGVWLITQSFPLQ